jgi:hypothetical protein
MRHECTRTLIRGVLEEMNIGEAERKTRRNGDAAIRRRMIFFSLSPCLPITSSKFLHINPPEKAIR